MPNPIGLYIHIPFCGKKCPYCDFYSIPFRSQTAVRYTDALVCDILSYRGKEIAADTLYFGGGTPSLLSPLQIEKILDACRTAFYLDGEITMEANPNTVTPARLEGYRRAGVNRISFGMQSADSRELSALGRSHSAEQTASAVRAAAEAGFSEISLDLMLGTPYQTRKSACETVRFAAALPVTHISAYLLKVEDSTPYADSPLLQYCKDEDELADIYLDTIEALKQTGFIQYEISNFARPGHRSRHNLKYWRCEDYLGFGAAAHSCFQGRRYFNPPDAKLYFRSGPHPQESDVQACQLDEKLMLGLRLTEGISLALLGQEQEKLRREIQKRTEFFSQAGYMKIEGDRISLTPKGFLVSNSILTDLLAVFSDS